MAGTFEALQDQFNKLMNNKVDNFDNNQITTFLKTTIKKVDTIIKTLDKMLKKRGIDIGELKDEAKEKSKGYISQGKDLFKKENREGLMTKAKDKITTIKSKLSDVFKSSNETTAGPPSETQAKDETKAIETQQRVEEKAKAKEAVETQKKSRAAAMWDKVKARADKRSAEIAAEKAGVKSAAMAAKDPFPWLGKILTGITTVGSFLIGGIGKLFGGLTDKLSLFNGGLKGALWDVTKFLGKNTFKAVKFLGKHFGKALWRSVNFLGSMVTRGLGNVFSKLIPSLSGTIARITQGGVGAIARTAGTAALNIGKTALRAAPGLLRFAGGMVLRAGAALATTPVGLAVIGGAVAIYGGYKLYKYLTRNSVSNDIYGKLTNLRLLMYGYNDIKKEHYHQIFDLEMLLKEHTKYVNYKFEINKLDQDTIDKIFDIFSIGKEETDKQKIFNDWLVKRFVPSYKVFMQTLYNINSKIYLDDLDALNMTNVYEFMTKMVIPQSIYDCSQIPTFEDPKTLVTKTEIDILITNILNECKAKMPENKDQTKQRQDENKKQVQENRAQQTNVNKSVNTETAAPKAPLPTSVLSQPTNPGPTEPNKPNTPTQPPANIANAVPPALPNKTIEPDVEGESKPTIKEQPKQEIKVSKPVNIAPGELYPGSTTLEGITTKKSKETILNLDPNVRELFTGMAKEYNTLTGKSIPVNEAFRSYEDQARLYREKPGLAAKPGNSTHEFGLAIDINSDNANELEKLGLLKKYGFTRPIGTELWHIEPIGVSINPTQAKKDPNFRMKSIITSPGRGGDGYGTLPNAKPKGRDTAYQLSIYNKPGGNVIDPAKAIKPTQSANVNTSTPASAVNTASTNTTSQPANLPTTNTQSSLPSQDTISVKPEPKKPVNIMNPSVPTAKSQPAMTANKPSYDLTKPKDVPVMSSNVDSGQYANLSPVDAIKQAAKVTGMDENTLLAYAKIESGLRSNVKNTASSAAGLFQIVTPTWDDLIKRKGPQYGIPANASKSNPYYNAVMAAEYAKENLAQLTEYKSAGIEDSTAMYLAHHYGPSGANKIITQLKSDPNNLMRSAVSNDAYNSNQKEIGNHTVGSYVKQVSYKIQNASNTSAEAYTKGSSATATTMTYGQAQQTPSSMAKVTQTQQPMQKPPTVPESKPRPQEQSFYKAAEPSVAQPNIPQSPSNNINIDTSKVETILNSQLDSLKQVVTLLSSIDGKFDIDKLNNITKAQGMIQAGGKSIPKGSVNLSTKM